MMMEDENMNLVKSVSVTNPDGMTTTLQLLQDNREFFVRLKYCNEDESEGGFAPSCAFGRLPRFKALQKFQAMVPSFKRYFMKSSQ